MSNSYSVAGELRIYWTTGLCQSLLFVWSLDLLLSSFCIFANQSLLGFVTRRITGQRLMSCDTIPSFLWTFDECFIPSHKLSFDHSPAPANFQRKPNKTMLLLHRDREVQKPLPLNGGWQLIKSKIFPNSRNNELQDQILSVDTAFCQPADYGWTVVLSKGPTVCEWLREIIGRTSPNIAEKLEIVQRTTTPINPDCNISDDYGVQRLGWIFFRTHCTNMGFRPTWSNCKLAGRPDRAIGKRTVKQTMIHTSLEMRNMIESLIKPSFAC